MPPMDPSQTLHPTPLETAPAAAPDTHDLSLEVVQKRILISRATGYSSEDLVKKYFALLEEIIAGRIGPDAPFALVEDWSALTGASLDARKQYIHRMRTLPRMKALIFCGVSPKFRMGIMLARRFRTFDFKVLIARDVDSALALAREALDLPDPESPPSPAPGHAWSLSLEGFRMDCEVIENDILHTVSSGYLTHEHVDAITEIRQRIANERRLTNGFSGIIANVTHLEGASRTARRKYNQSLISWYRQHPFGVLVYYGANRIVRAGMALARPFVPFGIRIAGSLAEAVTLVKEQPATHQHPLMFMGAQIPGQALSAPSETAHYARQIVDYLGTIQWEEDGIQAPVGIATDHPFAEVFDTIALIKGELDDLFRERRIAETGREQLHQQLEQAHKMESIGTLAGGISHDFNNILGIIQGNADMALDEAHTGHPLRPYLEEIQIACNRGTSVVHQLLHFAQNNDPEKQATDLTGIVRESLNLLRAMTPASIRFSVLLPENPVIINAQPTQIHQVMINMCTNAAHAMDAAGGVLTVNLRQVEAGENIPCLPRHLAGHRLAELTIRDTGHGIAPEIVDRVFDPYFTTKTVGRGTGLGLSVVHGIVVGHGGHIHIESQPGDGARFTLWFPLSTVSVENRPAPAANATPRGTERILVVDDEIALVRLLAQLLGKLGYRVDAHTSADAAKGAFEKAPDRYRLVITDMEMPGLTGTMLAEHIKAIRPDIPIILCTGFSQHFSEEATVAMGFMACLTKPLDRNLLARCVRQAIDGTERP